MFLTRGLRKLFSMSQTAIYMEKQLGWAHKLDGEETLGISKAGHKVLPRLIELQI